VAARAWNDDVKFTPAKIVSSFKAAEGMQVVVVDVGKDVASSYTTGGQYLQMKVGDDGKPAYLAIASAPEASKDGKLEFLIKNIPGSNHEDIISLGEGQEVRSLRVSDGTPPVRPPMGGSWVL
jgi:hypothetical protein